MNWNIFQLSKQPKCSLNFSFLQTLIREASQIPVKFHVQQTAMNNQIRSCNCYRLFSYAQHVAALLNFMILFSCCKYFFAIVHISMQRCSFPISLLFRLLSIWSCRRTAFFVLPSSADLVQFLLVFTSRFASSQMGTKSHAVSGVLRIYKIVEKRGIARIRNKVENCLLKWVSGRQ